MRDHKLDLIGAKAWIRIAMRLGNKLILNIMEFPPLTGISIATYLITSLTVNLK